MLTTDARVVICAPGTASLAKEARDMVRKEEEGEDVKVVKHSKFPYEILHIVKLS